MSSLQEVLGIYWDLCASTEVSEQHIGDILIATQLHGVSTRLDEVIKTLDNIHDDTSGSLAKIRSAIAGVRILA